ncbi:unnamed protein product [Pseudo-nitzschia multistriata]|uniref:Uncharacterized protein n=1 Tax=Pseudo-nitzschia multistriata TaxID=183589 RepID=A0A448ZDZ5_9STRA|nr:unnamed protein product [Pseudo-nitzschia multistriata]
MSATDHLVRKEKTQAKLYDVESMMEMKGSEANGYVILLKGSPPSPESSSKKKAKKKKDDNLPLAFMSLTSGNVIDACFGVVNPSRNGDTPARRSARDAKALLDECDVTDAFRQTAVNAYREGFEAVIRYEKEMGKLNCITRCFRSSSIRRKAEEDIHKAFASLVTAVGESKPE